MKSKTLLILTLAASFLVTACGSNSSSSSRDSNSEVADNNADAPNNTDMPDENNTDMPEPVDCQLSDFSDWSECSAACDGGTQERTRDVLVAAENGGAACGELTETQACNEEACPAVDCQLSDFSDWSECSESCGGGTQRRTRDVLRSPENGGAECDALSETQVCNTEACPPEVAPVDLRAVHFASGAYYRLSPNMWVEANNAGNVFYYELSSINDSSVVFEDLNRANVSIRIDLVEEKIFHTVASNNNVEAFLYDITEVQPETRNGFSTHRVEYTGEIDGAFKQLEGDTWLEYNGDNTKTFTEHSRTEDTIILAGTPDILIDLAEDKIYIYDISTGQVVRFIYDIETPEEDQPTAYSIKGALAVGNTFAQVSIDRWEVSFDGQVNILLEETHRDEFSVYMRVENQSHTFQVDLFRGMVIERFDGVVNQEVPIFSIW